MDDPERARIPRESLADAWQWATQNRHATTALLQPAADDRVVAFDYLVDTIQRRTPAGDHIPEPLVRAAIDVSDPADADSLAATAYQQGRYALAERAYRKAWQEKASDPGLGAEHPDTLTSRNNRALALHGLGRLEEAEAEHRAVLEVRTRVLGAEHPDTLTSRDNRALVLHDLGRLEDPGADEWTELHIVLYRGGWADLDALTDDEVTTECPQITTQRRSVPAPTPPSHASSTPADQQPPEHKIMYGTAQKTWELPPTMPGNSGEPAARPSPSRHLWLGAGGAAGCAGVGAGAVADRAGAGVGPADGQGAEPGRGDHRVGAVAGAAGRERDTAAAGRWSSSAAT